MGAANEFDVGPLTWVKGEIEQALAKAAEALAAYAANPLDSTQLKFCKTHLHQAHGALEIVGLEGVTKLTEACEQVLQGVEEGALQMSDSVRDVLSSAFVRLTEYLNELVEGAPHQPVRLFPAYKAVMELRGAERIVETDLFFPDLTVRPPKREVADMPADMREHVLAQRRRFQMGLLRWLRNSADSAALKEMAEAVRGIERMQAMPQHRAFWWVTIGFCESLQSAGGEASLDAKRLCARIDLQMKRLMEGSQNVAERLLRDALYFVAKSRVDSPQMKEIRSLYGLEGVITDDTAKKDVKPQEAGTLRTIREILASAKDKWNQFSAGQTHELSSFKEQAVQLEEKVKDLGNNDFAKLTNAISKVTVWVAENPSKVTESIALETATALLLAENAAENFARLSDEFPAQVNAMGMRLKASLAGQVSNAPEISMLDEMTRKAQERLLMAQVVSEIKSNLSTIEGALDGFFRDTAKRGELPGLDGQIRQVQGALTILGADRAVQALAECQADIARFASPDYAPQQADFEKVATTMSGLGFFVEALQHGPADFDAVMQPITPKKKPAADESADGSADWSGDSQAKKADDSSAQPEEALTVEAELEQEKKDARTLFDAWAAKPEDPVLGAELKASLESIKQDADLVDEPWLSTSARRALDLLGDAPADAAALTDLTQEMQQIAPAPVAVPAAAPAGFESAAPAAPSTPELPPEEVDAELLAIFLEEAQEVMGTIGTHLEMARANPTDKETLTVIRRAFHTLKGSGRMVGLMRFGDAGWAVEQTMNQWLQEGKTADAVLLALLTESHTLFSRWVDELAATGVSGVDGAPLIAAAERVRAGEPMSMAAPAPAVPEAAIEAEMASAFSQALDTTTERAPFDTTVVIGDIRVSAGLYNIFVEESDLHLNAMRRELVTLADEPQPPRDELIRAVHTLAGIAGTVNFAKLNELGRAFERMLIAARARGAVFGAPELGLSRETVDAFAAMVGAVKELRPPAAADHLLGQLEAYRAEWAAQGSEAHAADAPRDAVALLADDITIEPVPLDAAPALDIESLTMGIEEINFAEPVAPAEPEAPAVELPTAEVPIDFSELSAEIMPLDAPQETAEDAAPALDISFDEIAAPAAESAHTSVAESPSIEVDFAALTVETFAPGAPVGAAAPHAPMDIDFGALEGESPALEEPAAGEPAFEPALDMNFDSPAYAVPAAAEVTDEAPVEIDMAALASFSAEPAPEAPAITQAAEEISFDAPVPAAEAPVASPDFTFHIEDITLPPQQVAEALQPQDDGDLTRFISSTDVQAAAVPAPVAELPELGERTVLVAASGALDAAAFEQSRPRPVIEPIDSMGQTATHAILQIEPLGLTATHAALQGMTDEELRERGFDPSERRTERIEDEIDEQLLPIFVEEGNELVPQIGEQLRAFAADGKGGPTVPAQALQRSLHTLKGSARMAGAMALGQLTHSMETRVENALQLPIIPPAIFEGLMSSFDRLTMLMDRLRTYDPSKKAEMAAIVQQLLDDDRTRRIETGAVAVPASAVEALQVAAANVATATAAPKEDMRAMLRVRADVIDRLVNEAGEVAIARSRIEGEMRAIKASMKELTENASRLKTQLREIEIAAETQMQSRIREAEEKHTSFDPLEFDRFTRFQEITRMMAESVNDVGTVQINLLKNLDDADAALLAQGRLNRDLQNDLMRVRMVPFNNVAERLYRVVRQTAKEVGKRANLDIRGTQTEIDRSVLERMTGPFEHLLRNAIAHGLEDPAGRAATGKSDIGQILLTARQEGNEFKLVFEDDGAGLNIARIRAKAITNGLMTEDEPLSDAQISEFIFAAGFSTAAQVSEVSGRGVGMDVVRAEVIALGGRVEVVSTPGKGTRFTISLPLTLAVTQVVLVRAGHRMFAFPSAMVEQVRQVKATELAGAYAAQAFEWQDRQYPLFYLPRLLGDAEQASEAQRFTPILLLRSGAQRAAVHVDEMIGNQEVVVKNIGPQLARVSGIAGATVLGTGQIVLILNPVPLALQISAAVAAQSEQQRLDAPELAAQSAAPTMGLANSAGPASTAPLVMVVDDSLTVRKITTRLLAREKYEVLTAKDGVDALEQLQEVMPDVMLVDIEMPRMDGFDLTRNIRGDAKLRHIPIIMITSRTAEKHRNYAVEIGVNVFLGKPYQEEELLEHIGLLLKEAKSAVVA
ncbi:MAG: histidine kinase, gyrase and HSP90-like ATPase family protein [Betaproteobacteria bacterium]|nr:histidine kinase, gyrase and HSP90-like ATPase family protein [Betaproteobacteria bacterium]